MLFRRLLTSFPNSEHASDAQDRVALLDEALRARASATRVRELEARIAELTSQQVRLRAERDSVVALSDASRRSASRLEADVRDRDEQLRALRLELKQLKEIDLNAALGGAASAGVSERESRAPATQLRGTTCSDRTPATKEIVQQYLTRLQRREDGSSLIADDMVFSSHASAGAEKSASRRIFCRGRRFYGMIVRRAGDRRHRCSGEKACALTALSAYSRRPVAAAFESDVAEIFAVRNGKIALRSPFYFDTAPT
jgi:hypothetical protein